MYTNLDFGENGNDIRRVHIYRNQGIDMTVELKDGTEFTEHYAGENILNDLNEFIKEVQAQEYGFEDEGLPTNLCLTALDSGFRFSDETFERVQEEINDYLSDKYGFCVDSWAYQLRLSGIEWDTEE